MLGLVNSLITAGSPKAPYDNTHCLRADGSEIYINMNTSLQAILRETFSISCWAKTTDGQPSEYEAIVGGFSADNGDRIIIYTNTDGKLGFQFAGNGDLNAWASDAAVWENGVNDWKHIVVTLVKNGTGSTPPTIVAYVNGTVIAGSQAKTITASNQGSYTSVRGVYIGGQHSADDGLDNVFSGFIDEVAIFSKLLTQSVVNSMAHTSHTKAADLTGMDNLEHWYKLNNDATDATGNSNGTAVTGTVFDGADNVPGS